MTVVTVDAEVAGATVPVPLVSQPRPIFVIGSLRSGASLLTLSLGQHPNILRVLETNWFEPLAVGLQHAYSAGITPRVTSQLDVSGIEIEDFFEQFGETVDKLMLRSRSGQGAQPARWVDGTQSNSANIPALLRLFPHAKFIHVLRDVSEVVSSLTSRETKRMYKSRYIRMTSRRAADHWLQTVTACVEAERAFGSETIKRIRRSDLLNNPEETVRSCLEFLDEPFDPACLRPFRPPVGCIPETTGYGAEMGGWSTRWSISPTATLLSGLLVDEARPAYPRDEDAVLRLQMGFSKLGERDPAALAGTSTNDAKESRSKKSTPPANPVWRRLRAPAVGQFFRSRVGSKTAMVTSQANPETESMASPPPMANNVQSQMQAADSVGNELAVNGRPRATVAEETQSNWSLESTGALGFELAQSDRSSSIGFPTVERATTAQEVDIELLKVEIEPPDVSGESVVFRWNQSGPNPFQRVNSFFFRYEGLDLSQFSTSLLYEIFLGLQTKVFAAYGTPVEVTFPEPLPRSSVAYWRAFHNADLVSIGPIAAEDTYAPWTPGSTPQTLSRPYGVFFGGGKDSTLAACLLSELYDPESVVLIQFVGPLRPEQDLMNRLETRQETMMLQPARERLGMVTQRVWTNYQAEFIRDGYRARPHLDLYTVGALPALLSHGVSLCTFSIPRTAYANRTRSGGNTWFRYAKSRPEILATQSDHYRIALGADITVTDINILVTELMAYRILSERYPSAFNQIVMCTQANVDQRWCYHCKKCAEYALFGLNCGIVDSRFDYDYFFSQSKYVRRIVDYAGSGVELSVLGNAPWQPFLSTDTHYLTFCHVIHKLDPSLVADKLSKESMDNLLIMKATFGNRAFPSVEMLPAQAIELLGHETARQVARIAAEHVEIVDELPGPILVGNEPAEYDFSVRMPTRTASLPHLQTEPKN